MKKWISIVRTRRNQFPWRSWSKIESLNFEVLSLSIPGSIHWDLNTKRQCSLNFIQNYLRNLIFLSNFEWFFIEELSYKFKFWFQGRVYAVGGFNGSLRVRTVDFYDPLRDAWSSAPNMEARRSTLGVAVLNDCIYAVGGFDGSTGLNSAEVLDLSVASPMMVIPISMT